MVQILHSRYKQMQHGFIDVDKIDKQTIHNSASKV